MSVWFEGSNEIEVSLETVQLATENLGELFTAVVTLMPGLTTVEFVEQGSDYVTIKTNEGLMKRTNISTGVETGSVVLEFDEEYKAGSMVTATSHFKEEFKATPNGVTLNILISDLKAPGIMGFFYRKFGNSNTGNAFLAAYKTHFEK